MLPKARAAAEWVRAPNPDVHRRVHASRLTETTAALLDDYDVVVDGSDSFDTCYVVADAAADRGLPVVWGSVARFDGQVSVFWDAAPDGRARRLPRPPPESARVGLGRVLRRRRACWRRSAALIGSVDGSPRSSSS